MEKLKGEARAELAELETERRALQTEWVERQRKRIADLEKNFLETQKRLEVEVARLVADIKGRETQAQLEKRFRAAGRENQYRRRSRQRGLAVLETLATSQPDLATSVREDAKPLDSSQLSAGDRIAVRGFKQPLIFAGTTTARRGSRTAAHEGSARGYRRHRGKSLALRRAEPPPTAPGQSRFMPGRARNPHW